MPRNVRNFWLDLRVDGKSMAVQTGPRHKDGGFKLLIYMRDRGAVQYGLSIVGLCGPDGRLTLQAYSEGKSITKQTRR